MLHCCKSTHSCVNANTPRALSTTSLGTESKGNQKKTPKTYFTILPKHHHDPDEGQAGQGEVSEVLILDGKFKEAPKRLNYHDKSYFNAVFYTKINFKNPGRTQYQNFK